MIKGIGIDIIEIERVKKTLGRRKGFVERFFAAEEAIYYQKQNKNAATIAGGFAAKEAIVKAMGTGFDDFSWKDIVVLRNSRGKPEVELRGRAKGLCECSGIEGILVSISHSKNYAVAQAIAIGGDVYENCDTESNEGN